MRKASPAHRSVAHSRSDSFDRIVKVVVGPEKEAFCIHACLLCDNTEFFIAALQGNFRESVAQLVEIPKEKPETFKEFQHWLYTVSLSDIFSFPALRNEKNQLDQANEPEISRKWQILFDLYLFADHMSITAIHDDLIDKIIDVHRLQGVVPCMLIPRLFDSLPAKSPLGECFVDLIVAFTPDDLDSWWPENGEFEVWHTREVLRQVRRQFAECSSNDKKPSKSFQANRHLYHLQLDSPANTS